jgi:hypothetical protein
MTGNNVLLDTNIRIFATTKQHNLTLLSDDWDDFVGIDDAVSISDISFLKP